VIGVFHLDTPLLIQIGLSLNLQHRRGSALIGVIQTLLHKSVGLLVERLQIDLLLAGFMQKRNRDLAISTHLKFPRTLKIQKPASETH
jgi:hypothetical protein